MNNKRNNKQKEMARQLYQFAGKQGPAADDRPFSAGCAILWINCDKSWMFELKCLGIAQFLGDVMLFF